MRMTRVERRSGVGGEREVRASEWRCELAGSGIGKQQPMPELKVQSKGHNSKEERRVVAAVIDDHKGEGRSDLIPLCNWLRAAHPSDTVASLCQRSQQFISDRLSTSWQLIRVHAQSK